MTQANVIWRHTLFVIEQSQLMAVFLSLKKINFSRRGLQHTSTQYNAQVRELPTLDVVP
jgi:hypothetical protein